MDEGADGLEHLEQQIIQHIRTAGLRKPKETSLVDELLELRKLRRQVFARLNADASNAKEEVAETLKITRMKKHLYKADLQAALDELKARFKLEATQSRERIVEAAQQEIAQVKSMYEEKLGALASRISDMESHHAQEKAGSAEQRQGWEEKEQRIHADYAGRMHKYQSALKTMAKREPHFTESISKLTRSNEQLSQEVDRLTNGLESAQEAARRAAAELEELRSERESTKRQAADKEIRSRAGMAELKQQHASELASIDKKVRELVVKKDATISALRTDVAKLRRDKQAMETFLKDLNAGIRAPTTTQRTR